MTKVDKAQERGAVGSPLDGGVGRPVPERDALPNRWRVQHCPGREPYFERHADGPWAQREPVEAELAVMACQVQSLRAALAKVLDTREKEAKAWFSYENARDNFSGGCALESRRHQSAMMAAITAEKEARLLLATIKTPNVAIKARP